MVSYLDMPLGNSGGLDGEGYVAVYTQMALLGCSYRTGSASSGPCHSSHYMVTRPTIGT